MDIERTFKSRSDRTRTENLKEIIRLFRLNINKKGENNAETKPVAKKR